MKKTTEALFGPRALVLGLLLSSLLWAFLVGLALLLRFLSMT